MTYTATVIMEDMQARVFHISAANLTDAETYVLCTVPGNWVSFTVEPWFDPTDLPMALQ